MRKIQTKKLDDWESSFQLPHAAAPSQQHRPKQMSEPGGGIERHDL